MRKVVIVVQFLYPVLSPDNIGGGRIYLIIL